jgi:hypothetical protein
MSSGRLASRSETSVKLGVGGSGGGAWRQWLMRVTCSSSGKFWLQHEPDHLEVGGEGGEAKIIGEVWPKQSRRNQGVAAREEIGRERTTMSIWDPGAVSRVLVVVAACKEQ